MAAAALDGVNVALLALMALVTARLARAAVVAVPTLIVATASLLLARFHVSSAWLIIGGGSG